MNYETLRTNHPLVTSFFDEATNTITYVVTDLATKKCAVIDSVLDYEPHGATISYESAEKVLTYVRENNFSVEWILETHVHADHLSAATYIKEKVGGKIAISKAVTSIQEVFGKAFLIDEIAFNGGLHFDVLFEIDEVFSVGSIPAVALYVPGHTKADIAYVIGDSVFVGDTLFMPDYGSARCDFPGGSAETLYASVQKLYTLPDTMKMFMCHDYLPEGRKEYVWETTIAEQKAKNIHLSTLVTKEDFVGMRNARDSKLGMPRLIIPSIQVNIRGGELPHMSNGDVVLTVPVNSIFSKKQSSKST